MFSLCRSGFSYFSADSAAAVFAAAVGVRDRGGGAVWTDHRLFGRLLLPALLAGAQQRPLDLIGHGEALHELPVGLGLRL